LFQEAIMVEPTRVPLQPIRKGSLAKLWLGIVVVLALAAAAAWWSVPQGVKVTELVAGSGPHPAKGDVVFLDYVGKLPDGKVFDQSQPLNIPVQGILPEGNPFPIGGNFIAGFSEGLQKVQAGGKYELRIPASKAYGDKPPPGSPIPPNSDLVFDVTIHAIMPEAEFEQRAQMVQQMMQQMQQGAPGGQGAPGEPGEPAPPTGR
jgi:FKBP-type peptidyl-prolyl cis-trans isomerase FkpA